MEEVSRKEIEVDKDHLWDPTANWHKKVEVKRHISIDSSELENSHLSDVIGIREEVRGGVLLFFVLDNGVVDLNQKKKLHREGEDAHDKGLLIVIRSTKTTVVKGVDAQQKEDVFQIT